MQKFVKMAKTIYGKFWKVLGNMLALTSEKGLVVLGSLCGTSYFDKSWSILVILKE